uniref:Carbohydrate kinase PfkB domain-containing protein n=1 Tax=Meloidogyne incognita TaxID=6306 RepID=A0A914MB55_MELIC
MENDEFLGEFLEAPDLSKEEIIFASGAGDCQVPGDCCCCRTLFLLMMMMIVEMKRNVILKQINFEQHMKGKPKVVCIGSAIVDIEVLSTEETKEPKKGEISYFPAEIKQRAGGVARNHAEALARLDW